MLDQEWGQSHPTAEFTAALAREITALMEFSSDDASDEASPQRHLSQPSTLAGRLYHIEPVFSLADPMGPAPQPNPTVSPTSAPSASSSPPMSRVRLPKQRASPPGPHSPQAAQSRQHLQQLLATLLSAK